MEYLMSYVQVFGIGNAAQEALTIIAAHNIAPCRHIVSPSDTREPSLFRDDCRMAIVINLDGEPSLAGQILAAAHERGILATAITGTRDDLHPAADTRFVAADAAQAATTVIEMANITNRAGTINIDSQDLFNTLTHGKEAVLATGGASGDGRLVTALETAINRDEEFIKTSHTMLVAICHTPSSKLMASELMGVNESLGEWADDKKLILGMLTSSEMSDEVRVTIVAVK